MSDTRFERFDQFLGAIAREGIIHVIRRDIREIRPRAGEKFSVTVGLVHEVTFVAYRGGSMYSVTVPGDQAGACTHALAERGIETKVVSGNIG